MLRQQNIALGQDLKKHGLQETVVTNSQCACLV